MPGYLRSLGADADPVDAASLGGAAGVERVQVGGAAQNVGGKRRPRAGGKVIPPLQEMPAVGARAKA